jgi:hypothetical protein
MVNVNSIASRHGRRGGGVRLATPRAMQSPPMPELSHFRNMLVMPDLLDRFERRSVV